MAVKNAKTITYNIEITEKGFVELTSEATKLNQTFSAIGDNSKNFSLALKAITKDVQNNTKAHGRTVNAINAEIKAVEELQSSFAKNNEQYRSAANRIKALNREKKALTDISSKEIRQELTLEQQIAKLNDGRARTIDIIKQEITLRRQIQSSTSTNRKEFLKEEIQIKSLERELNKIAKSQSRVIKSSTKMSTATKNLNKKLGNTSSATGAASGAVIELGRTISDSNYGFPAMANNVQQLATQMTFVVAEQGGVVKGFKAIGKAMRGAGGILLLFTVAITLLERFALKSRKVSEETDSLSESIGNEVGQLKALISVAKNENLQKSNREEAIREINKKYPEYLDNLELEKIRTDDVTKSISKQIELEVARVKTKLLSEKVSKAQESLAKAELKTAEQTASVTDKIIAASKVASATIKQAPKIVGFLGLRGFIFSKAPLVLDQVPKLIDAAEKVGDKINEVSSKVAEKSGYTDDVLKRGAERRNKAIALADSELKNAISELNNFVKESGFSFEQLFGLGDSDKQADKLASFMQKIREKAEEQRLGGDEQALLALEQERALSEARKLGAEEGGEELLEIQRYYGDLAFELLKKQLKEFQEKRKEDREEEREAQIQDAKDLAKELTTIMSERFKEINRIITSVGSAFDAISKISESYHEGEIQRLQRERDFVQNNNSLSESEKLQSLERIKKEEEKAQVRKIKAEQTFLMVQQGVLLAETIMNSKKMIMEQNILALKLATMSAEANAKINISAVTNMAEGKMSIGTFFSQLGVGGGIAFAAAIGGIIATIVSAKKQAKNQIASITGKSPIESGGGGSQAQPPEFNIVGASQQSQLAQTIAQAEQQPTRAYVVAEDVTTAQQLDRNIIQGASLG